MNEAEAQSENEIADNIDSEEIPEDQEEIDIPAEDEDFNEAEDQTEEAIEDDSAFDDEDFSYDDTEYEESESEDDNELREETMLVIEDKDITLDLNGHTLDRNLYAADADGHVIIVRSNAILYLTNNSDKEAIITGGFANNGGAINNKGILYVDNVAFKDNHASYTDGKTIGRGGAIYKEGTLTMRGCIIGGYTDDESNSVSDGGAIYNNTTGDIFLKDVIIRNNVSVNHSGGGIDNYGKVLLEDCELSFNRSNSVNAGAIWNGEAGEVTIYGCSIEGNRAENGCGGGIIEAGILNVEGRIEIKNNVSSNGYHNLWRKYNGEKRLLCCRNRRGLQCRIHRQSHHYHQWLHIGVR